MRATLGLSLANVTHATRDENADDDFGGGTGLAKLAIRMLDAKPGPLVHAEPKVGLAMQPDRECTRTPSLARITIEAAARGFYREAVAYGFSLLDFVRFADVLLGIAMSPQSSGVVGVDGRVVPRMRYLRLPLSGPRITIRHYGEPGDRQLIDAWIADRDGRLFFLSMASGQNHDVDALLQSQQNLVGMIMFEGRPVGCLAYLDHNPSQHRAELRKMIGDPHLRGRGLGREASELWVGYGLGALALRKVYVSTLSTDIRNIKLNEALGFRVEGILRNEVFIDGRHRDVLRMGLWHDQH
jgi:RimJ/RimL family protein N-acetyltransferase